MFLNILEQSLLFLPLALGIYISYTVLRIPDLTADGSFTLGAAVYAVSVHAGLSPLLATSLGFVFGVIIGIIVSFLQIRLRLNPLLAGILLVFILNSFTLKLMGSPNLSLFDKPSIFLNNSTKLVMLLPLGFLLILSLGLLLTSRLGLMFYAFGNNSTLLNLCGRNAQAYRIIGLSLSNGLVGCSGALTAQASGYADISMGTGVILIALGTVIIGQRIYHAVFHPTSFSKFIQLVFCWIGVMIYFGTIHLLLSLGFDPIYLRMMTGLCLLGFLSMAYNKKNQEVFS